MFVTGLQVTRSLVCVRKRSAETHQRGIGTMKVTVEYVAQMRAVSGIGEETLQMSEGATAQDVVRLVAGTHGGRLAELLLDESCTLRPSALVFAGEQQLQWQEEMPLANDARVIILAPLAGG